MAELLKMLLRLRTRLRQSQTGMARLIGCSARQYCRWEKEICVPGPHYLWKVLNLCPDEKLKSVLISGLVMRKPDKVYKSDIADAGYTIDRPPLTDAKAKGKRRGRPRALGPRPERLPDREFLADCGVEYFDEGDPTRGGGGKVDP